MTKKCLLLCVLIFGLCLSFERVDAKFKEVTPVSEIVDQPNGNKLDAIFAGPERTLLTLSEIWGTLLSFLGWFGPKRKYMALALIVSPVWLILLFYYQDLVHLTWLDEILFLLFFHNYFGLFSRMRKLPKEDSAH